MNFKLLLSFLLLACATPNPRAVIRREAEERLASCLGWGSGRPRFLDQVRRCRREAAEFCQARGLEKTCGEDGLWTRR